VRREQKTHVAESAPEIEHGLFGRGPRERQDVAVALAPLALRSRELRDAVELLEVLVRVEVLSEQGVRSPLATLGARLPRNRLLLASSFS
jgi:hypothetical protein